MKVQILKSQFHSKKIHFHKDSATASSNTVSSPADQALAGLIPPPSASQVSPSDGPLVQVLDDNSDQKSLVIRILIGLVGFMGLATGGILFLRGRGPKEAKVTGPGKGSSSSKQYDPATPYTANDGTSHASHESAKEHEQKVREAVAEQVVGGQLTLTDALVKFKPTESRGTYELTKLTETLGFSSYHGIVRFDSHSQTFTIPKIDPNFLPLMKELATFCRNHRSNIGIKLDSKEVPINKFGELLEQHVLVQSLIPSSGFDTSHREVEGVVDDKFEFGEEAFRDNAPLERALVDFARLNKELGLDKKYISSYDLTKSLAEMWQRIKHDHLTVYSELNAHFELLKTKFEYDSSQSIARALANVQGLPEWRKELGKSNMLQSQDDFSDLVGAFQKLLTLRKRYEFEYALTSSFGDNKKFASALIHQNAARLVAVLRDGKAELLQRWIHDSDAALDVPTNNLSNAVKVVEFFIIPTSAELEAKYPPARTPLPSATHSIAGSGSVSPAPPPATPPNPNSPKPSTPPEQGDDTPAVEVKAEIVSDDGDPWRS